MNSTAVGDKLENKVFDFISKELRGGRFLFSPEHAEVFRKKGYFSEKRKSKIVFDVSVEARIPGAADYSILILIECKNYGGSVPVDDLEEFSAKIEQVGGAKGILISNASLQKSALQFAKSSNIGYVRLLGEDDYKWVLYRSPSSLIYKSPLSQRYEIEQALLAEEPKSKIYDFFAVSGNSLTNSWRELIENLFEEGEVEDGYSQGLFIHPPKKNFIPKRSKLYIETKSSEILKKVSYLGGETPLEIISDLARREYGFEVEKVVEDGHSRIGSIDFVRKVITIFVSGGENIARERFTLCHEFGHLFLNHSVHLARETLNERDVAEDESPDIFSDEIRRLEWQANYFASCLLLPKDDFEAAFYSVLDMLKIRDRGHKPLYLDNQACNYQSFMVVTDILMRRFSASRSAVKNRLLSLGLLNDQSNTAARPEFSRRHGGLR
jgi:hypothetical protein